MKVDKLFVLGAGASYSATRPSGVDRKKMAEESYIPPPDQAPLDSNFIRALLAMGKHYREPWVGPTLKKLKDNWRHQQHLAWESLGLEKAIQLQAANMEFTRNIAGDKTSYSIDPDKYLDLLVHLVTLRLRMSVHSRLANPSYERFADRMFGEPENNHRIISFNYDDSLDRYLLNIDDDINRLYFNALKPSEYGQAPRRGGVEERPIMLKLHGSVNWNCKSEDIREIFKEGASMASPAWRYHLDDIWYRESGSPDVDDGHSPCIIPPITFKPVTKVEPFRHLWEIASRYLSECEELYFCGYSLPPTDTMATAMFGNFRNERLKRIVVIDPNHEVDKPLQETIHGGVAPNAVWDRQPDFSEFVRRL